MLQIKEPAIFAGAFVRNHLYWEAMMSLGEVQPGSHRGIKRAKTRPSSATAE